MKDSEASMIRIRQELQNIDNQIDDSNKKLQKMSDELNDLVLRKDGSLNRLSEFEKNLNKNAAKLQELEPKVEESKKAKDNADRLQDEINKIKTEILNPIQDVYNKCLQKKTIADEYETRKNRLMKSEENILNETEKMKKLSGELIALKAGFSEEELKTKDEIVENLTKENKTALEKVTGIKKDIDQKNDEIEECKRTEADIRRLDFEIGIIQQKLKLTKVFRDKIKGLGRIVAEERVQRIANIASEYFNKITNRPEYILWVCSEKDKYSLYLKDDKSECSFINLSGGEQISVAIAIRLALSQEFGNTGIIILDEPTNNLDLARRHLLAENLPKMVENLTQLFVVTHDDTFRNSTAKVIEFGNER
jgi:exonuclease SbcC